MATQTVRQNSTLPGSTRHPMEIWISYVLRIGVLVAGTIILIGTGWFLLAGPRPGEPTSLAQVLGGQATAVRPGAIIAGIREGDPLAIIQLGVLALILTPITRVAMTVVLFAVQGDRIFIAITSVVLLVLVLGLLGVGA